MKSKPTKQHLGDFHNRFFLSKTQFGLHSLQTLFQTYIAQWYITQYYKKICYGINQH